MTTTTREIHLAQRPTGLPGPDTYRFVERELRDLREGQVLVRNIVMSVDPYMRGRMNDVKSYVPPFQVGAGRSTAAPSARSSSRARPTLAAATSSCTAWAGATTRSLDAARPATVDPARACRRRPTSARLACRA